MAKKKRQPHGDRPNRRRPSPLPANLPDPRAMEGMMQHLVPELRSDAEPDTPLDRAQALLLHAFQETNEKRRMQLAKDALAICPDCADAYVLLAEHAPNAQQALELYQQGVAAGERAWAHKPFSETPATSGASSQPGRTCAPGWGWRTPSGPRAVATRPSSTCRTCCG